MPTGCQEIDCGAQARREAKSGKLIAAEKLFYAVGREGGTQGLGLEAIGITRAPPGCPHPAS